MDDVTYASPFVSLGHRDLVPGQLHSSLKNVFDLDLSDGNGFEELRGPSPRACRPRSARLCCREVIRSSRG